jgi:hypothetical protein
MKKGTVIALVIAITYCGLSTYALNTTVIDCTSESLFWNSSVFFPGYALGLVLGFTGGTPFVILGQIITLIFVFFFLKVTFNVIDYKLKERKN